MEEVYVIGRNPVLELLKTEKEIDKIYVLKGDRKGSIKKILGKAKDKNIVIQEVNKSKLDELSEGKVHQGVAALVTGFKYSTIEDIFEKAKVLDENPFIVILDEIEDPHNLGAIIRTCECAGVHGVIIPKRRSARVNQTVYKSSAGAVNHVLVSEVTNISKTIEILKDKGLWIYGADLKGKNYYYKESLTGAVGLVIGNEGKGISRIVSEKCDVLIRIPMFGNISSLNASTSAAILIYEVVRQNDEKKKKE
ncbi:MAG: 23S rRNA (guanosine(2251)-2'-O)-methyltransferase RlmB [Tissierella sp.]|uniref:23S rRNA (guanosine(2251)-2'-O)-methyltransferase RlmB n=1 Tax=Tissierella sp. TaxID=41274 RepID=UPI003F97848D